MTDAPGAVARKPGPANRVPKPDSLTTICAANADASLHFSTGDVLPVGGSDAQLELLELEPGVSARHIAGDSDSPGPPTRSYAP